MLTRSRTARRMDGFDRKLDALLTPFLRGVGFSEAQPYCFERQSAGGRDFVVFDVASSSFFVQMCFEPDYMVEIDHLYAHLAFPPRPHSGGASYLTPKCMTHRPKEYQHKIAADRDRALQMVADGLRSHALTWLDSLRDPARYADAVPPSATMYRGRANEVAGRIDLARAAYEDQLSRLLACWDMVPFSKFVQFEGNRQFVYLCLKLGRELDRCERVMAALDFRPAVTRL